MPLLDTFRSQRFIKFIIVGGFAAIVNFLSRIAFSEFFSFRVAVILAYVVGMTTAFVLSKTYVFEKSSQHVTKQFYYFSLVNLVAAAQVWLVSVGLAEYLFIWIKFNFFREEVAHLIGITFPIFTSYIGHKRFSFK